MITNNKIISFINYLNKVNSSTNIFYEPFKEDFHLGDYVVEFIIDNEKELNNFFNTKNNLKLEEFAREVIEYSTSKTVETIIGLNQYVQIDNLLTNRLSQLYEEFIYKIIRMLNLYETINLDYVNRIVMEHQLKLRSILGTIDELRIFSKDERFVASITCSEYNVDS